jgi:hypothetical protein
MEIVGERGEGRAESDVEHDRTAAVNVGSDGLHTHHHSCSFIFVVHRNRHLSDKVHLLQNQVARPDENGHDGCRREVWRVNVKGEVCPEFGRQQHGEFPERANGSEGREVPIAFGLAAFVDLSEYLCQDLYG